MRKFAVLLLVLAFGAVGQAATIKAKQAGNWSNANTWGGGVLPGTSDIADANSFTVAIDQDITCIQIDTKTTGGGFTVNTARTITADVNAGTSTCLTASHTSGNTLTINGNIIGGSSVSAQGLRNNSTGAVAITGYVKGGSAASTYGFFNVSTGSASITGDIIAGPAVSGLYNYSTGIVTVTGNLIKTITSSAIMGSIIYTPAITNYIQYPIDGVGGTIKLYPPLYLRSPIMIGN